MIDYSKLTLADALAEFEKMSHVTVEIIPPFEKELRITYKMTVGVEALPHDDLPRGALYHVDPREPNSPVAKRAAQTLWRSLARTLFENGADLAAYPQLADEFELLQALKEEDDG